MTDNVVDEKGRTLLHMRPRPPIGPECAPPAERQAWVRCPECDVGPGADHLKGCRRDRKRFTPTHPKGLHR